MHGFLIATALKVHESGTESAFEQVSRVELAGFFKTVNADLHDFYLFLCDLTLSTLPFGAFSFLAAALPGSGLFGELPTEMTYCLGLFAVPELLPEFGSQHQDLGLIAKTGR